MRITIALLVALCLSTLTACPPHQSASARVVCPRHLASASALP